jgi:hypothetical protein
MDLVFVNSNKPLTELAVSGMFLVKLVPIGITKRLLARSVLPTCVPSVMVQEERFA